MDVILRFDRALIRRLGGLLACLRLDQPAGLAALFWVAVTLHLLAWGLVCLLEGQPEWTWYIAGSVTGAVAAWLSGRDPAQLLEGRLALTEFGVDARWTLFRVFYLGFALLLLPRILGADYALASKALLLLEVLLFVALEYLLAFTFLSPQQLAAIQAQSEALQAALQRAAELPEDDQTGEPAPPQV
ncbi:MAG: hypothetical protein IT204_12805 [Fimbriimonadaceae bacterium]|nr:hypothetical protein [Fimbriimonadaceae bacterium]